MSGKTSVVRMIRWIKDNRPLAFRFHSNFAKSDKTQGVISIDDSIINVTKTSKTHSYQIDNKKPFRKMNRGVPDEVQDLLNLSDLNVQYEWDNPFLIRSSGQEIARQISKAINTDFIDKGVKRIKKRKSALVSERRFIKTEIEDTKKRLKSLAGLDNIRPLIKELKQLDDSLTDLEEELESLEDIKENVVELQDNIDNTEKLLRIKPMLKRLSKFDERIDLLRIERKELQSIDEMTTLIDVTTKTHEKGVIRYVKELRKVGECPTCFGPLDSKTIKRIKNELRL
jgi:vacuolar-type H+-ATPase subunit I/STV1